MNNLTCIRLLNDFITSLRKDDTENKLVLRVANKIAQQDFTITGPDPVDAVSITLFNDQCVVELRNWHREHYRTWSLSDDSVNDVSREIVDYLTGVTK